MPLNNGMDNKIIKDLEVELRTESKSTKEVIRAYTKKQRLISLLGGQCSKCGESGHCKLEFHHIGEKDFTIGQSKTKRISILESEIEKCVLLCCNCHAKEHYDLVKGNLSARKRKQVCLEYKNIHKCSICGYEECNNSLDFHHTNPATKKFEISKVITAQMKGITKSNISQLVKDELDKCIVVCKNCHRHIHFDLALYNKYKQLIEYRENKIREIQAPLDRNEVKRLFELGMKAIDISKHFKASKGTIGDILKSFGLTVSFEEISTRKQNNAIIIINLHDSGLFLEDIIEHTGHIEQYIRNVLRKSQRIPKQKLVNFIEIDGKTIKTIPSMRKFDPTKEELSELLKTNSLRQIGKLYGVSQVAVLKRKRLFSL